ncbi:MAG: hypothetical protein JF567_00955 [Xanthomonadales bacterium]|nr:hypothetical protein [Xanthomonadales bacterium]
MRRLIIALLALVITTPLAAQTPPAMTTDTPLRTSMPAAAPADVASIDAIMAALYDVISGPPGKARDWNRMRSLFVPEARMIPTGKTREGVVRMRWMTVNDYVATSGTRIENDGFHERELARKTDRFGNMAQVFSTYDGRTDKGDYHERGINSLQLLFDGKRWWIVSIMWVGETPDSPLPADYLPKR